MSAADEGTLQGLPGDAALAAAAGFPPGSVSKMEANIDAALGGDTKSISMLRSLKLFFERMGADQQVRLGQGCCLLHSSAGRAVQPQVALVRAAVTGAAARACLCTLVLPARCEDMKVELTSCLLLRAAVAVLCRSR